MTTSTGYLGERPMLIGGEWVVSVDGDDFAVETPRRRGEVIARVPRARAADVDRAVAAARAAFAGWRSLSGRARGDLLLKIADLIEANAEDLARTTALETGNALRTQARPEANLTAQLFRYFGGIASELKGSVLPLGDALLSYTRREPIGVVGAILPWNSPLMIAGFKLPAALAAGNTVVLKAAEDAPLAVLALADLCQQVLPPGVLNVLTGFGEECGAALTGHRDIDKISFTGSTEIGHVVMRAAADRILPVSLELGGKSPSIVFPDSDTQTIADGVVTAMRFTRQGQSCTAGSRLFVHADIYDSFLSKVVDRLKTLRVGDPLDEASDVGAIINADQFDRVTGYLEDGLSSAGARCLIGGLPPADGPLAEGWYHQPTVFAGLGNDWRLAREEIFGPVLVAIPWRDEDEVIRMANDSHYGLAAYVWGRDISRALRTAHALEAGWVQVNQGTGQLPGQPYGGVKQSGIGRESSLEGMLEGFTELKSVTVNLTPGV